MEIVVPREFYVQKNLTGEQMQSCLGIIGKKLSGVADKIYNFIKAEAGAKINEDVKTVIVAGGVIETLGLDKYLRAKLKKELGKDLKTFDDEQTGSGGAFKIYANESSVYAAALGMTIAAVQGIEIKTVLSLTYGTWATKVGDSNRVLRIFENRFAPLKNNENTFYGTFSVTFENKWMTTVLSNEEMYSAVITKQDCLNKKDKGKMFESGAVSYVESNRWDSPRLVVGTKDSAARRVAKEAFGVEEVFSDEIHIREKSTGKRVEVMLTPEQQRLLSNQREINITFEEGIIVSKNGTIRPFVKNVTPNYDVYISYWNERKKGWESLQKQCQMQDLEFYFKDGKNFKAQISDDD